MSECKWCDTCHTPYSDADLDSQAIQVQVPEVINGIKRNIMTVERHQCGRCVRNQQRQQEARRRELDATVAGGEPAE